MSGSSSPFSAAQQGLGYIYQPRLALLKILALPETTGLFIEKADDLEFVSESGPASLASLKHKASGDVMSDLSTDFWKSVRVWLSYFVKNGKIASDVQFVLMTTASINRTSFLTLFLEAQTNEDARLLAAQDAVRKSHAKLINEVRQELEQLDEAELRDFYSRITIYSDSPRITDIPGLVDKHLRTVRREHRQALFQRLEGWWMDLIIKMLAGLRTDPVYGFEVSDKLAALAEQFRSDSLPIDFRGRLPDGKIDAANDPRIFVEQLRMLDLSPVRIQNAIKDYYRAFEQRSSWARESLLISGEIEEYEDRLVDEWDRYRAVVFEQLVDENEAEVCLAAGRELYLWAEMETAALRIRERVTEPYVVRGAFHILANSRPLPRVHWHPRFLQRISELLGIAA